MRLSEWGPGARGRVVHVDGDGPATRRLLEMGILEGVEVSVVGVVPFGGPMHVRFDGSMLSIRRSEAEGVEVIP